MALRARRGARLRRAARGRAGVVALACAIYLAGGTWATWPALENARHSFFAAGQEGQGQAAPGDHLQTGYQLWLPGHQLEGGRAPWRDPYSFQPLVEPRPNFAGWPFGLPYWGLHRALGTVGAWNVFVLLGFVAAGGLCALWLRELGLGNGPAVAGGTAFALAPYLVGQISAGHLLGWIAMLLPLSLFAWERGLRHSTWWFAVSAAALASIPLSGQVHLALGAIPFFLLYALARGRALPVAIGAAGLGIAAGLFVYLAAVRGSVSSGSRSFAQVERYSAELSDFVSRGDRWSEDFVFLGWLTPVLALVGLVLLVRGGRVRLAVAFALGALVPVLIALGANVPGYETLWRNVPGLRDTRVPERLLPVACLALAALLAYAVGRARWPGTAALVVLLVLVDLHVDVFEATRADEGNRAYARLQGAPSGRVLEFPVHGPDRQEASVYLYYAMQAKREHPSGYSTLAPRETAAALRKLGRAPCTELQRLGVRYLASHGRVVLHCGGRLLERDGAVFLYAVEP